MPDDDAAVGRRLLEVSAHWRRHLRGAALGVFDELVPLDRIEDGRIERVVTARRQLVRSLEGYGNGGKRLFSALGLTPPETAAKQRGKKAA